MNMHHTFSLRLCVILRTIRSGLKRTNVPALVDCYLKYVCTRGSNSGLVRSDGNSKQSSAALMSSDEKRCLTKSLSWLTTGQATSMGSSHAGPSGGSESSEKLVTQSVWFCLLLISSPSLVISSPSFFPQDHLYVWYLSCLCCGILVRK